MERLTTASDLLTEPDPGPTCWLIEDLIVASSIVAFVSRWKTTKSYALLDMAISIVTGRPLFGALKVPQPGPVLYVCEESGRHALHRRLSALCRGRAIEPAELDQLVLSANERVKLDNPRWQNEILEAIHGRDYSLIVFDPLARMKAPTRNESAQNEMAEAIEFLRLLRHTMGEEGGAVGFVHHLGHQGEHMRGSSDLESVWESRIAWRRDGHSSVVTLNAEHREAESGDPVSYRIAWNHDTRSMRFNLETDTLDQNVANYLRAHPGASANEVCDELGGKRRNVLAAVKRYREQGGSHPGEPPGNHPVEAPLGGGSHPRPFRGGGTTTEAPGSQPREPLDSEAEGER